MARRKNIKAKLLAQEALELEKSGDFTAAIKLYQKASNTDPLNVQAWNRQMILYRKLKSKADEVKLIKTAIDDYKEALSLSHQNWLKDNEAKVESSRALAKTLGLLEEGDLPRTDHETLEKWETRLYLLEYRIKNARPKKKAPAKKQVSKKKAG